MTLLKIENLVNYENNTSYVVVETRIPSGYSTVCETRNEYSIQEFNKINNLKPANEDFTTYWQTVNASYTHY